MATKKDSEKKKETKKKDTEEKKETKKKTTKDKKETKKKDTEEKKETKKKTTKKTTAKSTKDEVLEMIRSMSVVELFDLVKELEEEFEVSAQAPVMAGPMPGGAEETEKTEEKKTFNPNLTSIGDQKLQVIKVVRQITKLGLREAKALVESVPATILEDVSKEEAEEIKTKLEEVGATVELK